MARQTADAILKNRGELTDDQKKALRAGASRAWYADLPGAAADFAGSALDYGAEGLARLLPSDLAGYDLPKSLGIRGFQRAMRDPAGGSKQMEQIGEDIGYIPPSTGTKEEEMARLFMGLADPVPLPAGMMQKVFSSPAVKAVSEVKQNKMPANQWISQLKSRGVKQDEMTWTGVEDWLKSQDKSVTKQDLDEYLEANQIQVQEVLYGEPSSKKTGIVLEQDIDEDNIYRIFRGDDPEGKFAGTQGEIIFNEDKNTFEINVPELPRREFADLQSASDFVVQNTIFGVTDTTKIPEFRQYTLPGGENYRELLLTLPEAPNSDIQRLNEISQNLFEKNYDELTDKDFGRQAAAQFRIDVKREYKRLYGESGSKAEDRRPVFKGGHYDEPNIVAHIRFNERVDADGNKVLFIEEIQSDWAQKGRKQGFGKKLSPDEEARIRDRNTELKEMVNGDLKRLKDEFPEESAEYLRNVELIYQNNAGTVPSAPFVMDTNQWTSLALKRMVRWATDNDFDQIAWTTGKQQAKRYDLSKQVDLIAYQKNSDGTYRLNAQVPGRGGVMLGENLTINQVEDQVGKELTEKIQKDLGVKENWTSTNDPKDDFWYTFRDAELEVGGEGMEGFYDKILVDRAKKLGKQYGSKVEKGELPQLKNIEIVEDQGGFIVNELSEDGTTVLNENFFETRGFAEEFARGLEQTGGGNVIDDPTVWTMNLTDKLKKAAKDGLPYYVALPPVVAGVQRESERQQINQIQAKQNAQRINAQ